MAKRLFRAIAHYEDGSIVKRHFQTRKARDAWAENRLEGYPEAYDHGFDEPQAAIPPAVKVEKATSEPIVFLVDYEPGVFLVEKPVD